MITQKSYLKIDTSRVGKAIIVAFGQGLLRNHFIIYTDQNYFLVFVEQKSGMNRKKVLKKKCYKWMRGNHIVKMEFTRHAKILRVLTNKGTYLQIPIGIFNSPADEAKWKILMKTPNPAVYLIREKTNAVKKVSSTAAFFKSLLGCVPQRRAQNGLTGMLAQKNMDAGRRVENHRFIDINFYEISSLTFQPWGKYENVIDKSGSYQVIKQNSDLKRHYHQFTSFVFWKTLE